MARKSVEELSPPKPAGSTYLSSVIARSRIWGVAKSVEDEEEGSPARNQIAQKVRAVRIADEQIEF